MMFRVCIFLAAFWMSHRVTVPVCAQIKNNLFDYRSHPSSRHYTMNDGLPETGINWVLQDSRGFIWLATDAGLSKFDGYKFTTYKPTPESATGIGTKAVNTLWEDHSGRLWVGHAGGLNLFDPKTEVFYSVAHDPDSTKEVQKFRVRKDGKLWICGDGRISIADPQNLSVERMKGLPEADYWDIAEAKDGSIWAASESGLVHIDHKTGKDTLYRNDPKDPKSLAGNITLTLHIDEQERLWVGGWGLSLFHPTTKSFTRFLTQNQVRHIVGDANNKLLIAHGRGLYTFDPQTFKHELIADGWSTSVMKDRQGILWHSTLWGLNQINPKKKKLRMTLQTNELVGACILSIVKDGNNDIWLLEFAGGAYRYDPTFTKVQQHYPQQYARLSADREGSVWLISSGSIEKYDLRTKRSSMEKMPMRDGEHILSTYVDSFGNIWLGEWSTVGRYNTRTKAREQLDSLPIGPYCFLEDAYKNLWIGSGNGLVRYNLVKEKLDIFENDPDDQKSLSNNTILTMILDREKNIWIGTRAGLSKMTKGSENSKPEFASWQSGPSGLPHDDVSGIVDGEDGTLWLTSGNIISHFDPKNNRIRNYDHRDGLDGLGGTSFIRPQFARGLRTRDGKIAFGTYCKGLVIFHPDSLEDNTYVAPVVITGFSTSSEQTSTRGILHSTQVRGAQPGKGISYTDEIPLHYRQNDFSIEFASLNYIDADRNLYKYRLEPYERDWISTTAASRVARYTNMRPGRYTFRVIGSNNDGVWNEEGAIVRIIITPPWWQTWWAYVLYGVTFTVFILYWRSYENKKIKLKHRAEHLGELDKLKTRFFANISHEFRTPITLILGPLRELYDGTFKGDQKPVFGTMMRNAQRLLRLINQLLELSKLDAEKMHPHPVSTDLVEFIREIAASYESLAKEKNIKYFYYPELSEVNTYFDPEMIEKVIHNILSNAFKFTNDGGEVIVYLKAEKNGIVISVKDSGVGIPADQLTKIFDRFFQVDTSHTRRYEGSGLGMAIAKEMVELNNGRISVESVEGKGSTFRVWLPLPARGIKGEPLEGSGRPKKMDRGLAPEMAMRVENLVANSSEDHTPVPAGQNPIILVVEDNSDMRRYIQRTLGESYQLIEASNGRAGVEKALEIIPDLVISDIMMPEMGGYELCKFLKRNERTSHVPVILLTAKADRDSKLTGLETGADDYLLKPFDAGELKLIVRNRIAERRKLQEKFRKEIRLEPGQIAVTSLDEKFLTKVLSIIEMRLEDEKLSVDELSREAGFSNMHFYRKIKALTGQTPSQFLRTIRLKRAAVLLSANSDNVTQIAYSVGFGSLSYFSKCFKDHFGVTPGQYSDQSTSDAMR